MSQDDLTSRLDSLESSLADIKALLRVAYKGTGAINAQVTASAGATEALRSSVNAIETRLSGIDERLRRLEAAAERSELIMTTLAKGLLAPHEQAELGFIPDFPFEVPKEA